MSLRDEIKPYIDGNGLVAPNLLTSDVQRGSDNGPMYTSEYYIMLKYNGLLTDQDKVDYEHLMAKCIDSSLHRAPLDKSLDAPDDYHGVYAAREVLGLKFDCPLNEQVLLPQLIFMSVQKYAWSWLLWPLELYTALVIATSCINKPISDSDSRRLSWLLIQGTKRSWLCSLASKLWYRRLYKDYGAEGMKAVAKIYYKDQHPFKTYWVDKG